MKQEKINRNYEIARERFAELGIDTETAISALQKLSLSLHCWQTDDVSGFENPDGSLLRRNPSYRKLSRKST